MRGPRLAPALNVCAVTRLEVAREDGTLVSTVRIAMGFWNIAVAVLSVVLLVTLLGYAFLENYTYRSWSV